MEETTDDANNICKIGRKVVYREETERGKGGTVLLMTSITYSFICKSRLSRVFLNPEGLRDGRAGMTISKKK
jgi:hypothetical protein